MTDHDANVQRVRTALPHNSIPLASAITGNALAVATRAGLRTMRCAAAGVPRVRALKRRRRPLIFVAWHGHDFLSLAIYLHVFGGDSRAVIMVPATPRGFSLLRFGERVGLEVVVLPESDAPSAELNRGIATMARLIRKGCDGLIAVDGPSGPAKVVKPGAFTIARRAGAVLIPAAAAATPAFAMRWRWDDHLVPLPFAKAVAYYGHPIEPDELPHDAAGERMMQERLARAIRHADRRARELCSAGGR